MTVADEFAALFVPQSEGERFEAGDQRDGRHGLKQRLRLVAFLQIVIGNARTEMMNMMEPDVAGEPLQDTG